MNGTSIIPSGTEAMSAGNVVFGGMIGLGIDAVSGAMNKYPRPSHSGDDPGRHLPTAVGGAATRPTEPKDVRGTPPRPGRLGKTGQEQSPTRVYKLAGLETFQSSRAPTLTR